MFNKKKDEVVLREYAPSEGSVAPTPGNKPVDNWPSMKMEVGAKREGGNNINDNKTPPSILNRTAPPVSGQTAPGHIDNTSGTMKRKQTMKTIGLVLIFTIGLFGYIGYEIFKFKSSGNSVADPEKSSVTAEGDIKAIQEKKALEEKLALMTQQKDEALSQIEARIDEKLKAFEEVQRASKTAGSTEQMQQLLDSQTKLQEQLAALQKAKEEDIKPLEGSSVPTVTYNKLKEIEANRVAEEKSLAEKAAVLPDYDIRAGLQTGSIIPAVLKTTIVSSAMLDRYFVTAETTEPYEIMPGYILPVGVKFLGKPTIDLEARRILVDVNKLQYKSTEINIKGCMLDYRGSPGLVTKYIDPMNQIMLPMLITSLASATASAMQEMATVTNKVTGDSYERPAFSAENAVLQGTSNAIGSVSEMMMQAQLRKQPIIIVKSGIPIQVQISEKLVLDTLIATGVIKPVR